MTSSFSIIGTILLVINSLLLTSSTHAFSVYRLGGEEGNSWKAGISSKPGEYLILDADGQVISRGALTMPTTYDSWEDTLTEMVDSLGGEWLRPFYVDPMLNLARDGIRNRIGRGISSNLVTSGECHQNASQVSAIRPMFDGDPATAAFFTATSSENLQNRGFYYAQNSIIDLGLCTRRHPAFHGIGRRTYRMREDAVRDLFQYIEGWYNPHRRHSALGYWAPLSFERKPQNGASNESLKLSATP